MSPVRSPAKKRPHGFTLIELLVVIFIIGILIAATLTIIPKVKTAVYGAQTSAQLATIATAIQQYYNDFKAYPGPLANNQLYTAVDSPAGEYQPYIPGAANSGHLVGVSTDKLDSTADPNNLAAVYFDTTSIMPMNITSSENLVLGLCGGLRLNTSMSPPQFEYHASDLLSVTITGGGGSASATPLAKGPPSLNPASPRKQQAYLNINAGDLSIPNNKINMGQFTDSANRHAADSIIPEFVDKFGEPLPILYFRTNVGGTAIAGFRNCATPGSNQPLVDSNNNPLVAQYDLDQNIAYTGCPSGSSAIVSTIGLKANNPSSMHGLQGLASTSAQVTGSAPMTDPIDTTVAGTYLPCGPSTASPALVPGANALAYFKDPSLNTTTSANVGNSNSGTTQGTARQKDGFILISAGPDRQYGTRDDIIYPGPLQP